MCEAAATGGWQTAYRSSSSYRPAWCWTASWSRSTTSAHLTGRSCVAEMLHGNTSVAVTFVAFDVLRVDGHDLTRSRWEQRRAVLEELDLETRCSRLADVFDDGQVLFDAVCEHGLEGIVAKRRNGLYRPAHRGWVKVKNPDYWRREAELASVTRTLQRRAAA